MRTLMLHLDLGKQFKTARTPSAGTRKPKLRIVSREPFSPMASFLLGWTAGIASAGAVFLFIFH